MSDFLTNLAARSLAAPTLRPRTRSRFEPEPDASPWATLAPPEPAEGNVPAPAARASMRPPSAPIEARDDRQPESEPARRMRPTPDRDEEAPTHRTERTHTATHTLQTTERVTERVLDRLREQHDTTIRIEAAAQPRDQEAAPSAVAPRHRHDEQPPRIAAEARQPSTVFVTRESRPSSRQAPAESPASSEPVIHVSIGRVEVRAAAPAAAPQRTRPRNAPMTVEDYAARRKAKGRP